MHVKIYFMLAAMLLLTAKGDPDPLTLTVSTPAPFFESSLEQDPREVLVYLTQEQLTALQTRQGILEPELEPQQEDDQQNDQLEREEDQQELEQQEEKQQEVEQQEEEQREVDQQKVFNKNRPFVTIQSQKAKTKIPPAPVKESKQQESDEGQQNENYKYQYERPVSDRSERNKYYAPTSKRLENERYFVTSTERPESNFYASTTEKFEDLGHSRYSYYNVHNEKKGDNINIKIIHPHTKNIKSKTDLEEKESETPNSPLLHEIYKLIPGEYIREKQSDAEPIQAYRATQKDGKRKLSLVDASVQREESKSQENEQEDSNDNEQVLDEENESKHSSEYKRRKQALNILDSIRKQSSDAEAANRRPVITKKVNSIARKVPVRQRYNFLVPQPDAVKVPQPSPAPREIVRRIPIEIQDVQEEEKQISYKLQKRLPTSDARRVYVNVDRPYFVERVVPVERRTEDSVKKPQTLTILGPTLKYYS